MVVFKALGYNPKTGERQGPPYLQKIPDGPHAVGMIIGLPDEVHDFKIIFTREGGQCVQRIHYRTARDPITWVLLQKFVIIP